MQLRTNIIPKTITDAIVTTFVILIIPTVYWFELFVVMPTFYEQWSSSYNFHFVCGTFILFNATFNYYATIVSDTSIKGKLLSCSSQPNWRFCSICETTAPPRSWHCNVCNICILKRDHHCTFTSCCIGHHNQRYFVMFVLYIFTASLYGSYYNNYFIYNRTDFKSAISILKIVFPLASLMVDSSNEQLYWFLYLIVLITCAFTGVLSYYHISLLLQGVVAHERNRKLSEYNLGKFQNIREVLGNRWYLVWFLPFVHSKLPHDGIDWDTLKNR